MTVWMRLEPGWCRSGIMLNKHLRDQNDESCGPLRPGDLIKRAPLSRWKTEPMWNRKESEVREGPEKTNPWLTCQFGSFLRRVWILLSAEETFPPSS